MHSGHQCKGSCSNQYPLYDMLYSLYFRFKNVLFEITAGDEIGLFEVSARFMGVAMEKVELVFQVIAN